MVLSAARTDSFCRVDVADTGPGIPESEQAAIFGRFARGAAARGTEGLGIGLYLARQIAAGQGGYIRGQKRAGAGQRVFAVSAPAGKRRIGRVRAAAEPAVRRETPRGRPGSLPGRPLGVYRAERGEAHSAARRRSTTVWRAAAR